jgi:hypothetical protein
MRKLMHILFLSCLKATELIEKKLNYKLSFTEKLQLRMHKSMCDACTNYEKQSIVLDKSLSATSIREQDEKELEQLKRIIVQKLENTGS